MPHVTHDDSKFSVTVLQDNFCNHRIQEIHARKIQNVKFGSKTDNPEKSLVTLQTNAVKSDLDENPPPVATLDAQAVDATAEQTWFDQDTTRRAEIIGYVQKHDQFQ